MIESMKMKSQKKKKKYFPSIILNKKTKDIEYLLEGEDAPLEEEIQSSNDIKEIEKIHERDEIFSIPNERIKNLGNLYLYTKDDNFEKINKFNSNKKQKNIKNPFSFKENSECGFSSILNEIEEEGINFLYE